MEVSIAGTRRLLARRAPLAVVIAFAVLAFLLILAFGAPATALGLDPSWTEVMGWAFLHHVQWGRDLVFTYGPFGFLQPYSSYVRGIFPWFAAGQIILPAALALTLVLLFRHGTLGQLLAFAVAYVCWASHISGDIAWALTLLFGSASLITNRTGTSRLAFYVVAIVLAPIFAVIALAKFSLFPLWALCIAGIAGSCLFARRTLRAIASLAIFTGAVLAAWVAAGQHLANLPLFLLRSLQLASAYGHAMGDLAPLVDEFIGLVLCAALLSTCAFAAWKARASRPAVIIAALVAAATVLFWLACFTRGDHWEWFFPAIALLPFTLIASDDLVSDRRVRVALPAITLAATLVAFSIIPPGVILRELISRPQNSLHNLQNLGVLQRIRESDLRALANKSSLPKMRARIGKARVDMVTWEQGLLLLNGFNYAPRPLFQSYTAYTPVLARLNEAYFLGANAPKFVMFKLDYIDNRVPMSEDGLALIALLKRYRPVLSENGFLLLERDDQAAVPTPVVEHGPPVPTRLGTDIPLPANAGPTIGFFHIRLSAFGTLYTKLFREPALTLVVKTAKGDIRHRLVRPSAAAGFVVNPPVGTNNDWVRLYFSLPTPEAVSLRVEPESKWYAAIFDPDIYVSFQPLAMLHADASKVSTQAGALLLYPGFSLAPEGDRQYRTIVEDGEESVFLHAPDSILFEPTPGHYRLTATYGVQGLAVRDPGCIRAKPDGIGVGIVLHHGGEQTELAHREINPFASPRDAGPHRLAVNDFDVAPGDVVEYRVDTGPAGNNVACDWSYVRDLVFTRMLQPISKKAPGQRAPAPAPQPVNRAGFDIVPISGPLRIIVDEGKPSAFLHAPSTVEFQPRPGRYHVSLTFGVQSIAVKDAGCAKAKPDGVGVSLLLRHGGKQSLLRHVEVDPFHNPGDGGPHRLALGGVVIGTGDILSYRVDPGHGGNNIACDWTYLRDFRVVPEAAAVKSRAARAPRR